LLKVDDHVLARRGSRCAPLSAHQCLARAAGNHAQRRRRRRAPTTARLSAALVANRRCARAGPVLISRLRALEFAGVLMARSHRGAASRHDLMVLDVEQPQPALLAQGEADHAPEFHELWLGEVTM